VKTVTSITVIILLLFTIFVAWGYYFTGQPIGAELTMMFSLSVLLLVRWTILDMKTERRCRDCLIKTECKRASCCPAGVILEWIRTNRIKVENKEQTETVNQTEGNNDQ
jgi:hypothetical protein